VNRATCDTRRTVAEIAQFWCDWASVELSTLLKVVSSATAGLAPTGEGLWQLLPTQPTNSNATTATPPLGGLSSADAEAPYRLMGFAGELLVFSVGETGATQFVNPTTRLKGQLITIAPLRHWTEQFPILDNKGNIIGIDWDAAADHFLRQREWLPVFSDDSVRGRGVWHDDGRLVVHCGDHLVVDGQKVALKAIESAFTYERTRSIPGPAAEEISPQEVEQLVSVIDSFNWNEPNGSLLAQGMLVVLLLGAALGWRPNAWLSGDSATGKTTLLELFSSITRCVGALSLSNESTAAGIRQHLGWDATPVLFDEVEGSDRNARARIQQVLNLMRQASSDSSAAIVKGSAGGQAVRCRIRSPFLLSSVSLGLKESADKNRTVLLALDPFTAAHRSAWANGGKAAYEALASDTELGARLLRRLIRLWAVFQANCRVFERVATDHYNSGRLGRVYGAVLAGAAVLQHDEAFTEEQALIVLEDGALGSSNDQTADMVPEHERCLQHLLSLQLQGVRVGLERREACQMTVAHALKVMMLGAGSGFDQQVASDELLARGVMIREMPDPRDPKVMCLCVVVSNNHPALESHFADTAWADWGTMLRRCADFHARLTEKLSFGGRAFVSRATAFPLTTLVGSVDEVKAEQRNPASSKPGAADPWVPIPRELAKSYGLAS
jgi:putative DNA primase/helicase